MEQGSYLLLCSDGLSNMVSEQEILYEVIHGGNPEDCCQRLLEIALKRGATDNVTVVLVQHDQSQ
jgi:protein phosphatase